MQPSDTDSTYPRRAPHLRWLFRALLALAIGAGLTWISAWACTIAPASAYYFEWKLTGWYLDRDGQRVDVDFAAVQGPGPGEGSRFTVGSGQWAEQMWTEMRTRPNLVYAHRQEQLSKFGFPCHALGYESVGVSRRSSPNAQLEHRVTFRHLLTVSRATAQRWHWPWGAPGGGDFRLPTRILPWGFAVDALFYGLLVFILLAAPPLVRRWVRRRRIPPGHCQKCGYNLTGNVSGRCPECGTPVVPAPGGGTAHR